MLLIVCFGDSQRGVSWWTPGTVKRLLSPQQSRGLPDVIKWYNLNADLGFGEITTTGDLAQGYEERYLSKVMLCNEGVLTHLAIRHEPGHPDPWIIAMNDPPHRATVQDYACRWGIEPMFSDFKSRGFQWENT